MAPTMTNTQLISSIYEAFNRGDIQTILSHVAADAAWSQPKTLPWGGDYRGPQEIAGFFQKLDASMETVSFEARENVERGDEVFSFGSYSGRGRKTGKTGTADWMFRWKVNGGKVVSFQSYLDTAALVAAM